ncbi:hypothetical protein FDP41_000583 [Naegleria fowleri]|uniref:DUF2207 domain-containing protein n=1 Tax=Naegleria fowleri TaxID=5763 RepID=A0A6A5CDN3_NAEFO|nr:uncharacterized protein FDP41_000583 [Naegleria fowleri]KAF0984684.1 hypothetical protein FDP41_000583 [Naegleria fowleri]CAG4709728.1 unnamed protein product [Naegleria fowleri]
MSLRLINFGGGGVQRASNKHVTDDLTSNEQQQSICDPHSSCSFVVFTSNNTKTNNNNSINRRRWNSTEPVVEFGQDLAHHQQPSPPQQQHLSIPRIRRDFRNSSSSEPQQQEQQQQPDDGLYLHDDPFSSSKSLWTMKINEYPLDGSWKASSSSLSTRTTTTTSTPPPQFNINFFFRILIVEAARTMLGSKTTTIARMMMRRILHSYYFKFFLILMILSQFGNIVVFAASSPKYSISRFHSELKLTDSNQCIVEVNEIVTYLFAEPTRKIYRSIPTNLPYGYARMVGEIDVTSMSDSMKISDVLYLKSGDGMKQIVVSLTNPTSDIETTQVTLQYKYLMNGPLFVSHNITRVAWSVGYEDAQSISNIEISVKFPTSMFSKISSSLKGFKVKQDGPETTATFPTSSITSPAGSYRPMFTANNLLFDTCQTYWYTNRPLLTIFGFYGITLAIMFVCLAVKIIHDNIESYKLEKAMERERHLRYARHKLHEETYDSNSDHDEHYTFLGREKKHAFDNL